MMLTAELSSLDDLVPFWRAGIPPHEPQYEEVFLWVTIPHIQTLLGRVSYEHARQAYILEFLEKQQSNWYTIHLYTEPVAVLMIRKYIRWKLGIRYIPSLKRIGDDRKPPPLMQPAAVGPRLR